jgi:hypothetical protein
LPSAEIGTAQQEFPVTATEMLGRKAIQSALQKGWQVVANLNQTDVIDMATVIAWKPSKSQAYYVRYAEGALSSKGWISAEQIPYMLDSSDQALF